MKFKHLLASLAGILCLGQTPFAASANALPAPFEAHYQGTAVVANISIAGELIMTLTHDGGERYQMTSEISPNGLGAMLASMSEEANGEIQNGAIRPLYYQHRVDGLKESQTELNFDWQKGVLQAKHDDERATLPLAPRVVDPLSLNLLVITDLMQGRNPEQYTFVDDNNLKTYTIKHEGEETLKTPLGNLRTMRVSQSRPGSSRVTTLWFAPDLDYLPVQITQEKKGKRILRMLIQRVEGGSSR